MQQGREEAGSGTRGDFLETTSFLLSSEGNAFYINRTLNPAFWKDGEIQADISRLTQLDHPSR